MTEPSHEERLRACLNEPKRGEVVAGKVVGFEGRSTIVELDQEVDGVGHKGIVPPYELSWQCVDDPAKLVAVGQRLTAEITWIDRSTRQVSLSAKACEDEELRTFLLSVQPGDVLQGTIADVRDFGVFVHLDGEPIHRCTGFLRVPELSFNRFDHPSDVVEPGQRVTVGALAADTRQGQVAVSLVVLQENPMVAFTDREGDIISGVVTQVVPFCVFVRVAANVEGFIHVSELEQPAHEGDRITVTVQEVDPKRRRLRLSPAKGH